MTPSQHMKSDNEGDDGDEEREPKLKYSQVGSHLKEILKEDLVSCVALHPKFICIGTEMGVIYILDYLGNVTQELRVHDLPINQLSLDGNGDHIASCFNDGRVLVTGMYNSIHNQHIIRKRRVRSVAIDPNYYKKGSGRKLIIGERQLILHEKIEFSRWKSTILEDATTEGGVKTIRWSPSGNLILWASHKAFRIYDLESKVSMLLSQFPIGAEIDFKSHLCWKGSHSVIVGWGDCIKVFTVQKSIPSPNLKVESAFTIVMEATVCGVGLLNDYTVVVGCGTGHSYEYITVGGRPFLQVVRSDDEGNTEFGKDKLSLEGFENCHPAQYSFDCLADTGTIVLASPKDVVVATLLDVDERVDWFLKHRKYEMALDVMQRSEFPTIRHTKTSVVMAFIDHLLDSGRFEDAAGLCPDIIKDIREDTSMWKKLLMKFAKVNHLRAIADYLPYSWGSPIEEGCYHAVLAEYLRNDHEGFLKKIKLWPHYLYNNKLIADTIWDHILNGEVKSNPTLLEALAVIYSHMKQYDKSLSLYAKLQSKCSFELIKKHNLYGFIHQSAKELMKLDSSQAIEAMLRSSHPQLIVDDLQGNHYFLYLFLDALYVRKPKQCQKFHTELVWLYADFERKKLMGLLKNSDFYVIQQALDVCKQRHFIEETVHLLGRMGNTKEALKLIFSEIKDFDRAIDFCKEHDDEELWNDIINFSLDKPRYINMLLKKIGTHLDPGIMIQRIDEKLEIPMLRDALVKMMQDFLLNIRVQEAFKKIVTSDHYDLHDLQMSIRNRGVAIGYDNQCEACCSTLVVDNLKGTLHNMYWEANVLLILSNLQSAVVRLIN